jgi:hypothetical protein
LAQTPSKVATEELWLVPNLTVLRLLSAPQKQAATEELWLVPNLTVLRLLLAPQKLFWPDIKRGKVMAKAKKLSARREQSSKRRRASSKPGRKNEAKRTPIKKSKFEVQRVGTDAASDAHARLEAMTLAKRIAALAVDVGSKRDEYRLIDPHKLASLLGVDDADKPGGDWKFVWNVKPRRVLAYRHINAPHGRTLTFEAFVDDDGGCVNLKTPYDERDSAFDSLSKYVI